MRLIKRSVMHRNMKPIDDAPSSTDCAELAAATEPAVDPDVDESVCQGCAELGEFHWAHLRKCLSCGYIGCCDSSPHRHATAHYHQSGHPVMRSAEPGESWRWCYVHAQLG
ncbi:UBP-type zinc finger domain-containing protein [Jongsikchunia kroppenstedtii]|uniref:UBP-type zinc finger domain-containing protein n=1 Tax=Jongsikchunia kroppenstedtii TaxID=1121721 RepID=UPI00036A2607|nr:UBP-type zinc finger domain-containing protein [Jongsikchunia kroppenstedtii]